MDLYSFLVNALSFIITIFTLETHLVLNRPLVGSYELCIFRLIDHAKWLKKKTKNTETLDTLLGDKNNKKSESAQIIKQWYPMNKKVSYHAKENIFYQQYMKVFSKGIMISVLNTWFIQCMNKAWRKSRDISSMQRQKIYPEGTLFREALSGCMSRKLGRKPNIRKTGTGKWQWQCRRAETGNLTLSFALQVGRALCKGRNLGKGCIFLS